MVVEITMVGSKQWDKIIWVDNVLHVLHGDWFKPFVPFITGLSTFFLRYFDNS